MAVFTRYYGAAAAGLDDGSSWANRKQFVVAGAINTNISEFDFTADSLIARIGPGTHTLTTQIAAFTGATGPSNAFPCILEGALSDGERWEPPDPDWCSNQPKWDDSTMPVLNTETNIHTVSNAFVGVRGIHFTASGRTAGGISNSALFADWCIAINSTSNASASAWSGTAQYFTNLWLQCTGSIYNAVTSIFPQISPLRNIRIQGNGSASSGNRYGWASGAATHYPMEKITVANNIGGGIIYTSTGSSRLNVANCTIVDNGGDGLSQAGTATTPAIVDSCMITGGHTNAINFSGTGRGFVKNTRMRGYTTGAITGALEFTVPPMNGNIDASGLDTDEYVNHAAGDYRIKSTSTYWGQHIGACDGPAPAGGTLHQIIGVS